MQAWAMWQAVGTDACAGDAVLYAAAVLRFQRLVIAGYGRALLPYVLELAMTFDSSTRRPASIRFWKRWHIPLNRFPEENMYTFPLGGNRKFTNADVFELIYCIV